VKKKRFGLFFPFPVQKNSLLKGKALRGYSKTLKNFFLHCKKMEENPLINKILNDSNHLTLKSSLSFHKEMG